jgi:hypothetical protein
MIIETISDTIINQCWEWALAADTVSGDHYAETRNQRNPVVRQKQLWKGKIGEFAVYQFLLKEGEEPSKPELTAERQTKHNPDLVGFKNKINFHVKTSFEIRAEGRSWVFEKNNRLTTSPNDNDYLCLCSMIAEPNTIRIDLIERASYFVGQYKPPINENLVTKCCIYAKDFPCLHALDFPEKKVESEEPLGF